MSQAVQTFLLYAGCLKYAVESFTEVYGPSYFSVLIGNQRAVFALSRSLLVWVDANYSVGVIQVAEPTVTQDSTTHALNIS